MEPIHMDQFCSLLEFQKFSFNSNFHSKIFNVNLWWQLVHQNVDNKWWPKCCRKIWMKNLHHKMYTHERHKNWRRFSVVFCILNKLLQKSIKPETQILITNWITGNPAYVHMVQVKSYQVHLILFFVDVVGFAVAVAAYVVTRE